MKQLISLCLLFAATQSLIIPSSFAAEEVDPSQEKIKSALQHERRTEKETARDDNRLPAETLEFFGFKEDMTVLELLPGGGWYTKILAPALEEKGKLYISIGAERVHEKIKDQPGFSAVELIPFDRSNFVRTPGQRRVAVPEFSFGVKKIDLALTFRNLHNFSAEGRKHMNEAVFEALNSGGHYGIIDHTRRHMEKDHDEVWRRMDPIEVIREVEAAGFEFVDYSRLHYRADDELRYEVGRKSVTGNSDRFTFLFKKP